MRLSAFVVASSLLSVASFSHATPLSYTFTTFGTDRQYVGSYAQGVGAVTIDAVPGTGSALTAFTYTLTGTASGLPTVQTMFTLGNVKSFGSTVGGTSATPLIDFFSLGGQAENNAFFNLSFNGLPPAGQPELIAYYAASPG